MGYGPLDTDDSKTKITIGDISLAFRDCSCFLKINTDDLTLIPKPIRVTGVFQSDIRVNVGTLSQIFVPSTHFFHGYQANIHPIFLSLKSFHLHLFHNLLLNPGLERCHRIAAYPTFDTKKWSGLAWGLFDFCGSCAGHTRLSTLLGADGRPTRPFARKCMEVYLR